MEHFIKHTSASKNNPLLLLMDNHSSHISLEVIDLCIENGITSVTFPPHCSHRSQPLDVSVFGPVKKAYGAKCLEWCQSNVGRLLEIHHVAALADKAMIVALTSKNIRAGFEATSICPLNADIFTEDDFIAANISDEKLMAEEYVEKDDVRKILVVFGNDEDIGATEEVTSSEVASTSTASTLLSALVEFGPVKFATPRAKSNLGRKPMKSTILTTPQKRSELQQKAGKKPR